MPPDRDATTVAAHAGLRLRPVDDFSLRAGVRGNIRRFSDGTIASLATLGPEVSGEWAISDKVSLAVEASRGIGDRRNPRALADDVTSERRLTLNPTEALTLEASGSFERSRVYGVNLPSDETALDLAAIYKLTPMASLELRYYQFWYRDRIGEDDYERRRFSAGASVTF